MWNDKCWWRPPSVSLDGVAMVTGTPYTIMHEGFDPSSLPDQLTVFSHYLSIPTNSYVYTREYICMCIYVYTVRSINQIVLIPDIITKKKKLSITPPISILRDRYQLFMENWHFAFVINKTSTSQVKNLISQKHFINYTINKHNNCNIC